MMNALRENRVRPRHKAGPPRWLIVVLIVVGILVVLGVVYAVMALLGGSDETESTAAASAPTCIESTSIPGETLPPPKKVTVRVLNATKRDGLARTAADALSDRGFIIKTVGNDTEVRKQPGIAELRYGPKARQQALLLHYYLPGAELFPLDRKGKVVDIALGESFEGIAPQAEVDLALTTPVVTQSGTGCPSPTPSLAGSAQASQPAAPTVAGGESSE